jgi:hypothetical protein
MEASAATPASITRPATTRTAAAGARLGAVALASVVELDADASVV